MHIQVDASLQAVKDIAEFYLEQLQIPVVGITGSVGKTSTKEVIASVLERKYRTLKTQGKLLIMSSDFLLQYSDFVMKIRLQFWKWESVILARWLG